MSDQPQVRPDPALALLELYESALPQVHGYLLSRCRDRVLAQDLTAETFLAAVTAARRDPEPVSTGWLVGIARHKLADHWRRAEREQRGLRLVHGSEPEADDPWRCSSTPCSPGNGPPVQHEIGDSEYDHYVGYVPEWQAVLEAAARLQALVPHGVLVGGTAAAYHARHRVSYDDDHVLADLRDRFDEVLAALEETAGWVTAASSGRC